MRTSNEKIKKSTRKKLINLNKIDLRKSKIA